MRQEICSRSNLNCYETWPSRVHRGTASLKSLRDPANSIQTLRSGLRVMIVMTAAFGHQLLVLLLLCVVQQGFDLCRVVLNNFLCLCAAVTRPQAGVGTQA